MNENIKRLIELIKENPDLPVVPFVDEEVVCRDEGFAWWMGSFGKSEVGEYTSYDDQIFTDRDSFENDYYYYNADALLRKFSYIPEIDEYSVKRGDYTQEELEENNKHEAELDKYLNEIADKYFKKAIFVYINSLE